MFSKAMVQGSTCLANIGGGHSAHGMLYTTPFLWFAGTGSLGCTSSCLRVLKGWNVLRMARGGQDPTNGLRQSTDVGESLRSTCLTATWSLLIRLWAGVLVYEPLGVTISLEGL